jgi:hypothetical protein
MKTRSSRKIATIKILWPAVIVAAPAYCQTPGVSSWNVGNAGQEWYNGANWSNALDRYRDATISGTTSGVHYVAAASRGGNYVGVSVRSMSFDAANLVQLNAQEVTNGTTLFRLLSVYGEGDNSSSNAYVTTLAMTSNAASTLYVGGTSTNSGGLSISLSYTGQTKWDIAAAKTLTVTGDLGGTGGIIKTGAGVLFLGRNDGTNRGGAHTYSGGLTLAEGTVQVGAVDGAASGNASVFGPNGTVTLSGGAVVGTTSASRIRNNVVINGDVGVTGIDFTAGNNNIRTIDLANGTRTLTVGMNPAGTAFGVTNVEAYTYFVNGNLVKDGPGTLLINRGGTAFNNFTLLNGAIAPNEATGMGLGTITFSGGTLYCRPSNLSNSNPWPNATTFLQASVITGTLDFCPRAVGADSTTIPGTGENAVYDAYFYGPMSLGTGTTRTISVGINRTLTISGELTGNGVLIKTGPGTLGINNLELNALGQTRSYSGTIRISQGTLELGSMGFGKIFGTAVGIQNDASLVASTSVNTTSTLTGVVRSPGTTTGGVLSVGLGKLFITPSGSTGSCTTVIDQDAISIGVGGNSTTYSSTLVLVSTDGPGASLPRVNKQAVAVTNFLTIANNGGAIGSKIYYGQIDVTSNDMIVRGGAIDQITDMARAGQYNGGGALFGGKGITSSVAAADATGTPGAPALLRYAIGVAQNSYGGSPLTNTFAGVTVVSTDVLVKFTYFGDANLDGTVDDTDFFLTNNGYLNNLSGWINGDFDYSGAVDDTDFFLLNNGYMKQGATIGSNFAGGNEAWRSVIKPGSTFYDATVTFFNNGYWASNRFSDITGASTPGNNFGGRSVPEPGAAMAGLLIGCGSMRRRRR